MVGREEEREEGREEERKEVREVEREEGREEGREEESEKGREEGREAEGAQKLPSLCWTKLTHLRRPLSAKFARYDIVIKLLTLVHAQEVKWLCPFVIDPSVV